MPVDKKKLQEFLGKAVSDLGATVSSTLVVVGEKMGLYKVLADSGPLNSHELAEKTGILERYAFEWLNNQAAGGHIAYDSKANKYYLTESKRHVWQTKIVRLTCRVRFKHFFQWQKMRKR
jgi:hypothetical protein